MRGSWWLCINAAWAIALPIMRRFGGPADNEVDPESALLFPGTPMIPWLVVGALLWVATIASTGRIESRRSALTPAALIVGLGLDRLVVMAT